MLSLKQRISSVFFPFFPLSKGLAIDVCCQSYIKPSSEIKRGEAQSQSQMQITKAQSEDTNVKKLAEDVIGLVNGVNKIVNATKKDKK